MAVMACRFHTILHHIVIIIIIINIKFQVYALLLSVMICTSKNAVCAQKIFVYVFSPF